MIGAVGSVMRDIAECPGFESYTKHNLFPSTSNRFCEHFPRRVYN